MLQDGKSHAASCHQRYTCDLKATQNLSYPWVHPWVQHPQSPEAAQELSSHWKVLSALWNPCPSLFAAHFSKHLGCRGGILAHQWQMYWCVGGFWCWWLVFSCQGDKWIYMAWNCWQQLSQFISCSLLTTFQLPRWAWEPQPFSETWKAWGQGQKETGSKAAETSCPIGCYRVTKKGGRAMGRWYRGGHVGKPFPTWSLCSSMAEPDSAETEN